MRPNLRLIPTALRRVADRRNVIGENFSKYWILKKVFAFICRDAGWIYSVPVPVP